jgi:very-short-patch-repair endonuclease
MNRYSENLNKGAHPKLFEFAQRLRTNNTRAEALLWKQLKGEKLEGLKFRRQHPISKFIADFYCHEKKLVIEVDGNIHDIEAVKGNDEAKDKWFEELGLKVIRFKNEEVISQMHKVLKTIKLEAGL